MGKIICYRKGAAHRAAPLADSPTSCPLSTGAKKHCHRRVAEHELNRASQQQPKKSDGNRLRFSDEKHQHAVISFADAAKVQQNYEITKLSSKKELPPVLPLGTNRRGISKAAHGAALLSELSSTEEPGCSELLRPAVCSFRTIASVLRRLESRFSSRYRLSPQTHADVQMHL